jgi:RHS repeat-associated protein
MVKSHHSNISKRRIRSYIFGFNGQEKLNEAYGEGNAYSFEYRISDPRIGRFLSIDPLFKKYPFYTPYQFAGNSSIMAKELEGLEGDKNENKTEHGVSGYNASAGPKMVGFSIRHPIAASAIGLPSSGSHNISTNSVRFSTRIGLEENTAKEGSEVNAFRHVLWQSTITLKFGNNIAHDIGNAHEDNPYAGDDFVSGTVFPTLAKADETIDLLNNKIGRAIGNGNPNADMQYLSLLTLEYFKVYGLWTATSIVNKKGEITGYQVTQTKISLSTYNNAKQVLNTLNEFGHTTSEWDTLMEEANKWAEEERKKLLMEPKY